MSSQTNVGIDLYTFTQQEFDDQKVGIDEFFVNVDANSGDEHSNKDEEILKRRREKKEEKHARKMAKIAELDDER